jgi:glycosyltransferase involved in cell wall biosynthesis
MLPACPSFPEQAIAAPDQDLADWICGQFPDMDPELRQQVRGRIRRLAQDAEELARIRQDGFSWLLAAENPPPEELSFLFAEEPDRISVILACFNAAEFISRTIGSVWKQTLSSSEIELIAVDDGSTDGSYELLLGLQKQSPIPMTVLTHPGRKNLGVGPSQNLGFRHARGEWIALLDADDQFYPRRLEISRAYLRQHPEAGAVCSYGRNVNKAGEPVRGYNGIRRAGEYRKLYPGLMPPFSFDALLDTYPIVASSLTFRRKALAQTGGHPRIFSHPGMDMLLVLKLSLAAPLHQIEEELVDYTHHSQSYTHQLIQNGWSYGSRMEIFLHLSHWMLRQPQYRAKGEELYRRTLPSLLARHPYTLQTLENLCKNLPGRLPLSEEIEAHLKALHDEVEHLRRREKPFLLGFAHFLRRHFRHWLAQFNRAPHWTQFP